MSLFRLFLLAGIVFQLQAQTWIKLTSPHFELYTTNGEKKGREALLHFEQVRTFFLQLSPQIKETEIPIRVIAFRNDKEYHPYTLNDFAAAYYTGSRKRDYIVMRDLSIESYPVAVHEYTHLFMKHTKIPMPIWLNEGFADLFSTLKAVGDHARVGEPMPGRIQVALNSKWMPLEKLADVGHKSAEYNEKERAGLFYAESWAVAHLLFLGDGYHQKFGEFLMSAGTTPLPELLQRLYGKTPKQVESEALAALTRSSIQVGNFPFKLQKSSEEVASGGVPDLESRLVLADLLAALNRRDEAKAAFESLAKSGNPDPEVESALGYLAWQLQDTAGARGHFRKAFDSGSKDPEMCYNLASLMSQDHASQADLIPVLERVVTLKPDHLDARLHLASTRLNSGDYRGGLRELKTIKRVDQEHAFHLFSALAFAYAKLEQPVDAQHQNEMARKYAKTPAEQRQVDSMASFLSYREKPVERAAASEAESRPRMQRPEPQPEESFKPSVPDGKQNPFVPLGEKLMRVEGVAKTLDCQGTSANLHVLIEGRIQVFGILDPSAVIIKHKGEEKFDFQCGPQKNYKVVVEYIAPKDQPRLAGVVKSLEF